MAASRGSCGRARLGGDSALANLLPGSFLATDPKEDHVAVLHAVVASLDAKLPRGPQGFHGSRGDQLVDRRHLGADEVLLEVGVDLARSDRRGRIFFAWPRAHLGLLRRVQLAQLRLESR